MKCTTFECWQASPGFFERTCLGAIAITCVIFNQVSLVVLEVCLSRTNILVIAVAVGMQYTSALITVAHFWMFPIPFTFTIGSIPCGVCTDLLVVASLGFSDRERLRKYFKYSSGIFVQIVMIVVCPTYNAIFLSLEGLPKLAFVLLLPLIKLSFKFITRKVQSGDDDLVPAFQSSVDIFDALYMTKCMQSAGTLMVGFGIILVDMAQNYVAIRFITKQTRHVQALRTQKAANGAHSTTALLPMVFARLRELQQLDERDLRFGSKRFSVSAQSETELSCLESISKDTRSALVVPQTTNRGKKKRTAIVPSAPPSELIAAASVARTSRSEASGEREAFIRGTTCLLHESEEVVVVEYIETVVPVLHAVYLLILYHLPNAKYCEDLQHMSEERLRAVVTNILIYAGLELLSLVHVFRMLKRSFGVSVVYQLAFALENEWRIYQCNFVAWLVVVFQFLLVHNGEFVCTVWRVVVVERSGY